jgi:hypothetical protein
MKPVLQCTGLALAAALVFVGPAALAQNMPQVRDSRTGKVWVPEPVSVEQAPVPPSSYADKAFDPHAQKVKVEGVVVQHPRASLMGTVPITAGPTVPLMTLDTPSLQVVPGRHWLSILYVTNNSASSINAVVACHFTTQGRAVENVRIIVPTAGPGERLGVPVRGPRYDIFVDRVSCQLITPT